MTATPPTADAQALLDRAARVGVHRLAIPTPFAVGRVNCWLIDDEPLTLLDAGPNSGKALDALERALGDHGRRVEDLQRIVVSHQHMDHEGLVEILARRSGAEVCAIAPLAPWLARFGEEMEADDVFGGQMMLRHGLPREVVRVLRAVSAAFRGWGAPATVTSELHHGGTLDFAARTLRVWHRPGHSPTDTVLHDEGAGLLLAADHLIRHISSNPLLTRPRDGGAGARPRALMIYLESMAATRAMEGVEVVLPGHGEPFTDPAGLLDERVRMHERRAAKIAGLIRHEPRTAYELGQALWGNVAVTQAYLCLSEVLGHVDLLLDRGEVVEEDAGEGVVRFSAA